ncbi:3-phosphoinositide-dependent kinase 2, partial [Hyphodiscus hymeniophilus]
SSLPEPARKTDHNDKRLQLRWHDFRSTLNEADFESTLSSDEFTNSGGSSHSNADSGLRNLETSSQLEDALNAARYEWPEGDNRYFLPKDALESLITPNAIENEIIRSNMRLPVDQSLDQVVEQIFRFAPKLFCILVSLRKAEYMTDFLEEDLHDIDLPFERPENPKRSQGFKLCSRLHPNHPIRSMSFWRSKWAKEFSREQWSVLSPVFEKTDRIEHYDFDSNTVLPFTRDEEQSETKVKEGGFDVFDAEVKMLAIFSESRQHAHLIRLLATFEFKGAFYLLFPYAKANLRDYWKQTPVPEFSEFTTKWLLRECKGIASAVQRIHGYQTTLEATEAESDLFDLNEVCSSFSESEERVYGRHGDIKPENILWSDEDTLDADLRFNDQGVLLIADFGLMRVHKTQTRFRVLPEQAAGSAPYEPPEMAEPRICTVASRLHDIWSLGCVYLEFITWLVCTQDGLQQLLESRSVRSNNGVDETFYTLIDNGISGPPRKAILKESVQRWIRELHNKPRCSEFVHDFVNLIADHMLIADQHQRIRCGPLNEKLAQMVRKAEEDCDYLVPRNPQLTQHRIPRMVRRYQNAQIIYIRQKNSYSKLYITRILFEELLQAYSIFPRIWDFMLPFSFKTYESDIGHAPFKFRRLGPLSRSHTASFECAYGFRYVRRNGRSHMMVDNSDYDPWSVRQTVIYQQYNSFINKVTFVVVSPSDEVRVILEDEVLHSREDGKRIDPFHLHLILIGNVHESWRLYIRSVERDLTEQSNRVILAQVQSQTERLSPLTDFAVNFIDRQRLKVTEDKILDLVIIFESLHNTISKLHLQCRNHCTGSSCVDCTCAAILDEFEDQMQDVQLNLKKVDVLYKRAQSTAKLVSVKRPAEIITC